MSQVFISYSRKDLSFVERLASDLKRAGLDVWYDMSGIGGGSRWRAEIESALKNSQFVIVVLSPDSISSEWVEREFLFANNLKRKIIPLMYRPCELPLNYINLNYIDVQGKNYQREFPDLLNALNINPTIAPLPPAKKSSFALKTKYLVSTIAVIVMLFGGLFVLQRNRNSFSPVTIPASPTRVTQPAFTDTPILTPLTEASPTQLIPTITPLPTEITDAKDRQMVLVPAGEFTMGSNSTASDEKPIHRVYLDAFYIDIYEVTNVRYKACVEMDVCDPPKQMNSATRSSYYDNSEFDNYPVIYVDWNMAKTYCEWQNARLPTEAQWEKAARGDTDDRVFPWGDTFNGSFANFCDKNCSLDWADHNYNDGYPDTAPVGSYPSGRSPYGIYDLAGNVWEWVADLYNGNYYASSPSTNPTGPNFGEYHTLRGGSWDNDVDGIRTSNRTKAKVEAFNPNFGFRCARDVSP